MYIIVYLCIHRVSILIRALLLISHFGQQFLRHFAKQTFHLKISDDSSLLSFDSNTVVENILGQFLSNSNLRKHEFYIYIYTHTLE